MLHASHCSTLLHIALFALYSVLPCVPSLYLVATLLIPSTFSDDHITGRSIPISKFTGLAGFLTMQELTPRRSSDHLRQESDFHIMQELMNSIIHQWSHSWYRSRYCPSSIVQGGGDTAINGTVPIYFRASPDLCHHIGRGISPHGRAVTVPVHPMVP